MTTIQNPTTLNIFTNAKDVKTAVPGQVIFLKDAPGDVMYVILEGTVEVQLDHGRVVRIGKGSIVGEMALIDRKPRCATVIAHTDCKLVPIDRNKFNFLVLETPYFAHQVMSMMADRLRSMNAACPPSEG
jgi:CRP/FNR family transcriptional regulator, cyclic AMP receptor protein